MTQSETLSGGPGRGDAEVVVRAIHDFQAGIDRDASFRVLVETYHRAVQSFFARRLPSPDLCLDLTQETFLRVYKGLEGFRGEAPFGAWLFRIAWNVLRRKGAGPGGGLEVQLDPAVPEHAAAEEGEGEDGAYELTLRRQRQALLRRAIAGLPPQRRRCMTLWAYHELPYEKIAAVLQLSVGTVKAHLAQARRQVEDLVLAAQGTGSDHE